MAKRRQLVLIKLSDPDDPMSATTPLGSIESFAADVADYNTAHDNSPTPSSGTRILHGPGFVVELALGQKEVRQALVTCHDESIAWPVLWKMCKGLGWKLQDMESGRMFG
ncbi:MAG: hypothetical protein CMJ31_09820 [Phycisphaerae bacterium]|nr:hypothetical protein [Phycisphaerae bacterium]